MSDFKQKIIEATLKLATKLGRVDDYLLGLDVSPNSIRLAELHKVNDKWETAFITAHEFNDSLNPARQQELSGLLKGLVKKYGSKARNIAVSLPMSSVQLQLIKTPLMSDLEIENAIQYDSLWDNLVSLPEDISKYSISYQVVDRDVSSNSMTLLFAASLKADIEYINKACLHAGLQVVMVDSHVFAVVSALQMTGKDSQEDSYVLVEIGDDANYVMVKTDSSINYEELYVSDQDKTVLRKNYSNEQIVEQFFARLALQVKQVLATSGASESIVRTIYVTSDLPSHSYWFSAFANSLPSYNLILFNPVENAPFKKDATEKKSVAPSAAASMGMSARSTDVFGYFNYHIEAKSLNLLPDYKKLRSKHRADMYSRMGAIISFALCFIVIFGLFVSAQIKISNLENQTSTYDAVVAELNKLDTKLASLNKEKRDIQQIIARSKTLSTNQVQIAEAYNLIAKHASVGGWLHSLELKGDEIDIVGFSRSERFILKQVNALSGLDNFESVQLGTVELKKFGEANQNALEVRAYGMTLKLASAKAKEVKRVK